MTLLRAGAAAALLAALLAAGCSSCGPPAPFTVRRALPPRAQLGPPPVPTPAPALRAAFLGDFGDSTRQQATLAGALAASHARAPLDLAFSPGDLLYECGADPTPAGAAACSFGPDGATVAPGFAPPADRRFEARFEGRWPALERAGAQLPVWLALGNHDVAAWIGCREGALAPRELQRLRACLAVAHRGPRWRMPARHYAVEAGPARFLVLDSNLLLGDYGGFALDGEEAFLREASAGCEARPCFVVAHHPAASAGGHRGEIDDAYVARLRRLQDAAGGRIAGWFAGHDHDLQHLRAPAGYDVFVSGQGSRGRPRERFEAAAPPAAQLFFASTAWGFAVLEVWPGAWRVRFEGVDGEPLHCCHASFPGGACQPVACPPPAP